ncbi:hypothetical protein M0R45_016057 [Rubus argutus]|uniref:Uncharacterized protein n=1 Tax=Rubus argutus TaxID=59490 RepID=A0AAW1XTX3_RUBAR
MAAETKAHGWNYWVWHGLGSGTGDNCIDGKGRRRLDLLGMPAIKSGLAEQRAARGEHGLGTGWAFFSSSNFCFSSWLVVCFAAMAMEIDGLGISDLVFGTGLIDFGAELHFDGYGCDWWLKLALQVAWCGGNPTESKRDRSWLGLSEGGDVMVKPTGLLREWSRLCDGMVRPWDLQIGDFVKGTGCAEACP